MINFFQKIILWSRHLYHELYKLSQNFTQGNMRKVSSCFLRLHLCDIIQFRDDHARMRIRSPLAPPACLKFWQRGKLFWAFMSYVKAIFGNIRTNRKEILPYGWLTHWKWATMVAKIGLLQLTITLTGGQAHYYSRTGTSNQRQVKLPWFRSLCFNVLVRE